MPPIPNQKFILIVEDDETISSTIRAFLESEGYAILTAVNGAEALDQLKNKSMPHLILLDMKMPVMNGWQFALEFLNRHDHKSPIVVMTAAADAEQRAKDIHAIGWVGKPFLLDELLRTIKKFER